MTSIARPLAEWHEELGDVLWWKFPIEEAPYCGTPLDLGQEVLVKTEAYGFRGEVEPTKASENGTLRVHVGGWPGYHTHWTLVEIPETPALIAHANPDGGKEERL